ncbi:uncharacterized protein LOC143912512 [Arctopsyche grandis]|uniref:uncharacterized protein LOC143912512 n=1 Tax=Arctopsyche grandis TaxID=121162 RepID=UPI00406D8CD6
MLLGFSAMECRLCLLSASPESYISIHDNPYPLAQRIGKFCRLQVNKDDGLSDMICLSCVKNLELFNSFRSVCLQSDETSKQRSNKDLDYKIEEVWLDDLIWEDESNDDSPANVCNSPVNDEVNDKTLKRKTLIVDVQQLMDNQQIVNEKWNLYSLHDATKNIEECLQWLAKRRLIKNSCICNVCGQFASLLKCAQKSLLKCAQIIDGFRWGCTHCNFRRSIRSETFFSRSNLPLRKIILIIYSWSKELPQTLIVNEIGVNENAAVDWCNFCREECEKWNRRYVSEIGGIDENFEPVTVEIDDSDYFHRKYHQDQYQQGHWLLGGIERLKDGTVGKCFSVAVPNRSAETLQEEILRHILPGSNIISNDGEAYGNIPHFANGIYTHSIVDSKDSELHTQNVDNMWLRAKRKLRLQYITSPELFTMYLHDFIFRNSFRSSTNMFGVFLMVIVENYPI